MSLKSKSISVLLSLLMMLATTPEIVHTQTVNVWLTTDNQRTKLQQQSSVTFSTAGGGSNPVFVDEGQVFQQIEGFGASFTDSSAYLLNEIATPSARTSAMNNLFHAQWQRHRY